MEESRSTWQMWHVRAEVQRQVRAADVPIERANVLVDLLVDEVLDRRSVALVPPRDGMDEPQALRRTDGSSVYTVAGCDLYTSRNAPGPLETTPRPAYRPCHLSASRSEGRRAAGSTHCT
jgi:hypothetical protein